MLFRSTIWRRERAEMIEARILDMEFDVISATEPPVQSPQGEMRKVAVAYEKALDRSKGLLSAQREVARLSRQTDRLIKRLETLQANRPPAPEPEIENTGNEPKIAEPVEIQQHPKPAQPNQANQPASNAEIRDTGTDN